MFQMMGSVTIQSNFKMIKKKNLSYPQGCANLYFLLPLLSLSGQQQTITQPKLPVSRLLNIICNMEA